MQKEQIDLVCETLDTMAEVLQGPCVGNQEFIANHPCMSTIANILEVHTVSFENLNQDE